MAGVGVAADAGGGCLPESVGAGAWGGGEHGGGQFGIEEGGGRWRWESARSGCTTSRTCWTGPGGGTAADVNMGGVGSERLHCSACERSSLPQSSLQSDFS